MKKKKYTNCNKVLQNLFFYFLNNNKITNIRNKICNLFFYKKIKNLYLFFLRQI